MDGFYNYTLSPGGEKESWPVSERFDDYQLHGGVPLYHSLYTAPIEDDAVYYHHNGGWAWRREREQNYEVLNTNLNGSLNA